MLFRSGATLAPSGGNTQFWQQPLRQDYVGDKECHSPNPIGHVHFLLSANSKFTQESHHRAPVRESRLKQIQTNKSREEVPVRAHVVSKCQRQQNKDASDQTKCSFYSHTGPPSVLRNFALRCFTLSDIFWRMRIRGWKRVSPLREVVKNRYCHSRQNGGRDFPRHQ